MDVSQPQIDHVFPQSVLKKVKTANPATGKMSRLALTRAQRDEILGTLRDSFGEDVTKGMREGQHPLVGAAASLYTVIGNSGYQLREGDVQAGR